MTNWKRWIALLLFVFLSPNAVDYAYGQSAPPKAPPLVYKSVGDQRIVRAVINGRLYLMLFAHKQGVWFLEGTVRAADLPKGPKS